MELARFKEAHFGDEDSPDKLENQVSAITDRQICTFSELLTYKAILKNVLSVDGVREKLGITDSRFDVTAKPEDMVDKEFINANLPVSSE